MKVLTMQLNSIIIMDLLAYGGAAVGIILATKEFVNGSLEMAPCLFMILLSADFFLPMRRLGSYFHVAMNGMAASDRIFRFLALEEPDEGTELFPKNGGNFLLKSVSFSYDGEREVLHRINMQIPKNSFMGIVGESGSGKSTIASLLTGRLTAEQGEISISGVPIADCTQESLMRGITYIGPSSYFFKGTVRDNLLMGDPSASDERLLEVLRTCRMDTFPGEESALDLRLTENAQNLSGGQKQRLALARALLHDSPVYIFDEATSNIDVESEQIIMDRIRALAGGKTVILISHRLVNTREADRIFVMENGKLVESGNHRELMKWGGTYAVLWRMQQKLERFGRDEDSGEPREFISHQDRPVYCDRPRRRLGECHQIQHFVFADPVELIDEFLLEKRDNDISASESEGAQIKCREKELFKYRGLSSRLLIHESILPFDL
jgi:ATP-binding cassette subfamily C protein